MTLSNILPMLPFSDQKENFKGPSCSHGMLKINSCIFLTNIVPGDLIIRELYSPQVYANNEIIK